jgi:hypothetical protein
VFEPCSGGKGGAAQRSTYDIQAAAASRLTPTLALSATSLVRCASVASALHLFAHRERCTWTCNIYHDAQDAQKVL